MPQLLPEAGIFQDGEDPIEVVANVWTIPSESCFGLNVKRKDQQGKTKTNKNLRYAPMPSARVLAPRRQLQPAARRPGDLH